MDKLKSDMIVAIAWGQPDHESIGFSQKDLCILLAKALARINYLEQFEPKKPKPIQDDI